MCVCVCVVYNFLYTNSQLASMYDDTSIVYSKFWEGCSVNRIMSHGYLEPELLLFPSFCPFPDSPTHTAGRIDKHAAGYYGGS